MEDATPKAKSCRKCGENKPLTDFYRHKECRDGVNPKCKACVLAYQAARYAERMQDPVFAGRKKAQAKTAGQKHYQSLSDEGLRIQRARTADWRKRNKEAIAAQYRAWRIANAQRVLEKNHRRRARLLDAFVAPVDPAAIWERDGGVCQMCREPIDPTLEWPHRLSRTIDHVVPLAKGGTHEPANVQLAHAICNVIKGDRVA